MKKYLKALVLLLCVCLCWAGVAWGESGNNIVEIGDASDHYTVTLGNYNLAQGKASLSLTPINAWPDKPVTTITAAEGTPVYLYAEPEKHYDNSSPGATASDTGVKISSAGTRYLYSFILGAQNVTITPNFELKKYVVTFYAGPDGKFDEAQFGGDSEWKLEQENSRAYRFFTYGSTITADFAAPTIEAEPWYVPEWRKQGVSTAFDFENSTVDGVISLNAVWKYTVAFDNNGGTGTMDGVTAYREDTGKYTLPGCTFTAPENKKFSGWSTQATGGTVYKPGDELTLSAEMFTDSTLKLYARWADVHTVTITCQAYRGAEEQTDVEGGSMLIYASEADMNAKENQLPGNSFSGIEGDEFYLVPQADAGYTCGRCERQSSVQGSGEINAIGEMDGEIKYFVFTIGSVDNTLNAKFYLNQYTVTFDLDGGKIESGLPATTPSNPTEKVYHGETVDRLDATPVKEDYTFMDWYQVEAKGAMASKPFDFTTPITSDVTLKAKWGIKITFDPNCPAAEVTGEMDPIITEPSSVWLDSEKCEYKREGYKFIGWCASATPGFDDIIPEGGSLPRTENRTFYAQWEKAKTVSATATLKKGVVGDDVSKMLAFYSDAACTQKIDGDVKGYSGDKVYMKINLDADTKEKVDESGIDVKCDSSPLTATNGVYEITLGKDDVTVNVLLPVKAYTVTVSIVGGKTTHSILVYHGEVLSERSEFTAIETGKQDCAVFAGLYEKDGDGNYTEFDFKNTVITSDVNLYARYKYAIYYDPSSDHPSNVPDTPYTQIIYWDELCDGNTVKLTKNTFTDPQDKQRVKGWQAGNTTFNDEQDVGIDDLRVLAVNDGKINLYAVWANVYTVTVKTEGGYSDVSVKIYTDNQYTGEGMTSYTGFTGDLIYLKADEGEGSEVYKWEGRGKGNLFPGLDMLSAVYGLGEDDEIIVSFKIKKYNVTFYGNGGKVLDQDTAEYVDSYTESVEHGELTSMVVATRDGCGLMDWYEKENNTWKDTPFDAETPITRSIDLYARWSVTVTFDANGGTGSMDSQTFEVNELTALKPNAFTREGYRFDCWTKDRDGNGSFISDEEDASFDKNTTLYAQWEEERTITAQVASEFAGREGFDVLIYTDSGCTEGTGEHFVKAIAGQTLYLKAAVPAHYQVKENGWSLGADDPGKLEANDDYGTVYKFTVGKGNATITVDFELEKIEYGFNAAPGKFAEGQEADGETMSDNHQEITGYVEYGSKITPPAYNPTYSDDTGAYSFSRWVRVLKSGSVQEFDFGNTPITDEIEEPFFRARYNATVTYDANGADNFTGNTQTEQLNSDISLLNPETTPTRPANESAPYQQYRFNGWNTAQDGTGTHYDAGAKDVELTSNMTLYAEWEDLYGVRVFIGTDSAQYIEGVGIYSDEACTQPIGTATVDNCIYYGAAGETVWLKAVVKEGGQVKEWEKDSGEYTAVSTDPAPNPYGIKLAASNANIRVTGKPATYSVRYDVNGGTWKDDADGQTVTVSHNSTVTKPTDPTKTGSVFMGWFEKDASGKFADNAFDFDTQIKRAYTLHAKWGYTVTYKPGYEGANQDDVVDTVEEGGTHTTRNANTFTRNGYNLVMWGVNDQSIAPGNQATINEPTVFTAQWEAEKFNLIFDANGGYIADSDGKTTVNIPVPYESLIGEANPGVGAKRDGYRFKGWYEKDENGDLKDEDFDFAGNMPDHDVHLYARWDVLYSITLHKGNGSEETEVLASKYIEGEEVSLPYPKDWQLPGTAGDSTFAGWNTAADGTGKAYDANDVFTMPGNDVHLYAQWRGAEVTPSKVIYHQSGEENAPELEKTIGGTDTTHTLEEFADTKLQKVSGKKFLGWRLGHATTGTLYQPGDKINLLNAETHVYAQWGDYTVTVKCDPEEGGTTSIVGGKTEFPGNEQVSVSVNANEGYAFDSWEAKPDTVSINENGTFTMPEADVTVTAHFEKLKKVTFNAGIGHFASEGNPQTITVYVKNGEAVGDQWPADPVFDHYVFLSWEDEESMTFKSDDPVNSDMTLNASWEQDKHTLTLEYNGGKEEGKEDTSKTISDIMCGNKVKHLGSLPTVSRAGFDFDDWYIVEDNVLTSKKITDETQIDHDITARAMWKYTVTFAPGVETGVTGTQDKVSAFAGEPVTLPACTYAREGYDFKGWMLNEGTTYAAGDSFISETGHVTLTAKWEIKKYTVTFDANGGVFTVEGQTKTQEHATASHGERLASATLTAQENAASKTGHNSAGWYTDAACTTKFDEEKPITSDMTLYMKWEPMRYDITFDAGNGWWGDDTTTHLKTDKADYGTKATAPDDPVYTSGSGDDLKKFRFDGWFTQAEGGTAMEEVTIEQATTFYAHWTPLYWVTVVDLAGNNFPMIHMKADHSDTGVNEVWVPLNTTLYLDPNPSTGYRFDAWPANVVDNVFAVTKAENSRICATYVKQVKVTFDAAQGGTFPAGTGVSDDGRYLEKYVDENSAITPPSPEPQRGFDLLEGWLYDGGPTGGNTSPFDFDTMVISKDSVLHAQWKTGVGVVLDADGGTLAEGTVSPQRVPKGGKAKEPADPTKEECTFLGWYLENAETPFDFGTALDKTITLKARWSAKTYTITIETEGHGTAASNPAGKAAAGTLVQLTATPETGYCLEKWETVSGGVLVEDGQFTMGKQDVTIKAFFGPAGVKVTFDTDGGTPVDPNPASAVYGKPLAQVPSTSKAGFTFQGWYEKDAETPFDFTRPLTGDVTLYARWTAESTPTVTPAPTPDINIIKQPVNTTAPEGGKGTFTVEAQGDGMTYQWFVDRGDGQGFVPCPGATGATYTTNVLKRENNGDRYYCQITTKDGTLRTDTVTLTVEATIPKTGDSANLALWLALTAVSCAGMMAMLQRRRQTK